MGRGNFGMVDPWMGKWVKRIEAGMDSYTPHHKMRQDVPTLEAHSFWVAALTQKGKARAGVNKPKFLPDRLIQTDF